jgi:hypothetical protein
MHRTRVEVFDESNRKRSAPVEPTDGLDQAKRQRLVAEPPSRTPSVQPLPSGEVSWRQLYTLNAEGSTANFDVQNFRDPEQLLRIVVPVLQSVNPQKLEQAISVCDVPPLPHTMRPPIGLYVARSCYKAWTAMGHVSHSCANLHRPSAPVIKHSSRLLQADPYSPQQPPPQKTKRNTSPTSSPKMPSSSSTSSTAFLRTPSPHTADRRPR